MRKEFYIDSHDNYIFKTTFYRDDNNLSDLFNGLTIDPEYIPDNGIVLHVSINRKILKEAIMMMIQYKKVIHRAVMFADCSESEIGNPDSIIISRDQDDELRLWYRTSIKDEDENSFYHEFDLRPFMPFDLINFLSEFKD